MSEPEWVGALGAVLSGMFLVAAPIAGFLLGCSRHRGERGE